MQSDTQSSTLSVNQEEMERLILLSVAPMCLHTSKSPLRIFLQRLQV